MVKIVKSMKKLLFLSAVAFFAASCSSDDDQQVITEPTTKLVKAEMKVSASQTQTTRAYLGHIDQSTGTKVVGVKFQNGDKMDIFESCSYSGTKYTFTDDDPAAYQNGNFEGTWSTDNGAWAAIFPSSSSNKMVSMTESGNIYEASIPQSQKTIYGPDKTDTYESVTYENAANVMVAAKSSKPEEDTPTCFLAPIVCYLYFACSSEDVDIVSTAGPICGTVKCTTNKRSWASWSDFNGCATITGTDSSAKTIHSKGIKTTRSSNKYEHIVCMIPGTFEANQLAIGSFKNTKQQVLKHVNMYYLGDIDPVTP